MNSAYYYTTILEGYNSAGFDVDILRQATENSVESEYTSINERL